MESSDYSLVAVLIGIILLGLGWSALNWVWLKPKKLEKWLREQGLKGNSYRVLFGDLKEVAALMKEAESKPIAVSDDYVPRVVPHILKTFQRYGKDSFIWFGPRPLVLLTSPDHVKEVLTKIYDYRKPMANPLTKLLVEGLTVYEEDKWAKHRKLINPAFHMQKLKNMLPAFCISTSEMLSKWDEFVSSGKGSAEVDVWPYLHTLTSDVISRTAFGSSYEEGRKIFVLQTEQAKLTLEALRSIYIPGWRFAPTKRIRRMKQIKRLVNGLIIGIINKRLKAMREGEPATDDLLGILLESNCKEIERQGNKDFGMSMKDVIEECKLFYFAGQETTSVLLVWTLFLLSTHQAWQVEARKEVLQAFGNNIPDFDGLSHLKIVTMVLNETLRLYPPAPMLNRKTHENLKLGNLSLPKGVLLSVPIILLHHDLEIWGKDAKEFKPQRFSEGVSKATNGQAAFFPFGGGPRICIGLNFAMLEAKMAMAMILQKFSFELSPSYSHAPHSIATVQPQYGVHLIFHRV